MSKRTYDEAKSSATLERVRETLRRMQMSKRSYDNLSDLRKDVALFSGVSLSTIRPERNGDAYLEVANYFKSLSVDVLKIPDEVASEPELRIKLQIEKSRTADLMRRLSAADSSKAIHELSVRGSEPVQELYHAIIQFIIRGHGSIVVDVDRGALLDRFPERGFDAVIAKGPHIRTFGEWLRSHPVHGRNKDIFDNG